MTDIHSCSFMCARMECVKAQRDELRDRIAALEADAARYRYLRDVSRRDCLALSGAEAGVWCDCEDEDGNLILLTESDLDAAIDAAMKG